MIQTGITGIDEMLGSGIPAGTKVLYSMEPGVDGRMFMLSTLQSVLSEGKAAMVVFPTSTASALISDIRHLYDLDLASFGDRVIILDSTVRERINRENKGPSARKNAWKSLLRGEVNKNRIDVLFIYFDLIYEDLGLEGALDVIALEDDDHKITTVVENLNLEGDSLISRLASDNLFDLIISLQCGFTLVPFFNFFTLEFISWSEMPRRSIPYTVSARRVRLYIPKIIVTGPPSSGKSTFVANASDRGISVDRGDLDGFRTTVAMDLGWLRFKGFDISIFGTPGQPRFDPIIPQLVKHAMGIVLVLDVTRPETLSRARELLGLAFAAKLPVVIAANKADLPHRMDEQMIRRSLKLREDTPIFFISAMKRSDVQYVIESMVDRITRHPY